MKLSDLIAEAQGLMYSNGDLDILDEDDYAVIGLKLVCFKEDNDDICVKAGDKIVKIRSGR
ncbi:MAG: hypothetical protein M0R48_11865 [Candidatus Omnitrophica bacterium]|nr:hypothetical protein [Candidatus Omnitrophota bacterium]